MVDRTSNECSIRATPPVNWQLQTDAIEQLCIRYDYDGRQGMIAKKIAGAGWVYM